MRRRSCTLFCLFFLSALMCLQRSMRICDMWYSPMLSSKLHGFPPFIELFLLSKLVFKRLDIEGLFVYVHEYSHHCQKPTERPLSTGDSRSIQFDVTAKSSLPVVLRKSRGGSTRERRQ